MFKDEVAHAKCTWYQAILGHRMMINFVVVLSDLWLSDLNTQLKKEAELSVDHHLVVGSGGAAG